MYLQLLKRRPKFRNLWLGAVVSMAGDWFTLLALYSLLLERTGKSEAVGLMLAVRFLPAVLFAPLAGVLADRFPRGRIMVVCDVLRAVTVLAFLTESVELVYPIVFLQMTIGTFFDPAEQAAISSTVEPEDIRHREHASRGDVVGDAVGRRGARRRRRHGRRKARLVRHRRPHLPAVGVLRRARGRAVRGKETGSPGGAARRLPRGLAPAAHRRARAAGARGEDRLVTRLVATWWRAARASRGRTPAWTCSCACATWRRNSSSASSGSRRGCSRRVRPLGEATRQRWARTREGAAG